MSYGEWVTVKRTEAQPYGRLHKEAFPLYSNLHCNKGNDQGKGVRCFRWMLSHPKATIAIAVGAGAIGLGVIYTACVATAIGSAALGARSITLAAAKPVCEVNAHPADRQGATGTDFTFIEKAIEEFPDFLDSLPDPSDYGQLNEMGEQPGHDLPQVHLEHSNERLSSDFLSDDKSEESIRSQPWSVGSPGHTSKEKSALIQKEAQDILGAFRSGKSLIAYQEDQSSGLKKYVSEYAGAFSRSLSDTMDYLVHHMTEFRSIHKFEHTQEVHILGPTVLADFIDISLTTHTWGGINEYGEEVFPHFSMRFKKIPEPGSMPYVSDEFEKAMLELAIQCQRNGCSGIKIWPLKVSRTDIGLARRNPSALAVAGKSSDILTFQLEWLDFSGDIVDSIYVNKPLFSGSSFQWLEHGIQKGSVTLEQGKEYVSLLTDTMLSNVVNVLKYAQDPEGFDQWYLPPCSRDQRQRFSPDLQGRCKQYDGHLKSLIPIELKGDSTIKTARLSKRFFLGLDYFARISDPAIVLIKL